MPELPEVETYRSYFARYALRKAIRAVVNADPKNFPGMKAHRLRKLLVGRQFNTAERKGKYLVARLDGAGDPGLVVIHFGMTGSLHFSRSALRSPAYSRTVFVFDDGSLHYVNMRRFGGIWWVTDLDRFERLKLLGPDPLLEIPSKEALKKILGRSRQPLKQALMNQKLIAGIGNLYADEILFQSLIDPRRRPGSLKLSEWESLFQNMKQVLNEAVRLRSEIERLPRKYLMPHRHGDQKCPRCASNLRSLKQGQRTTYYCPVCQS
ncbi:MAG TPA: DNA-formamidopyrimidine glycosylase family protein [Acidobacteriota bacterium]